MHTVHDMDRNNTKVNWIVFDNSLGSDFKAFLTVASPISVQQSNQLILCKEAVK